MKTRNSKTCNTKHYLLALLSWPFPLLKLLGWREYNLLFISLSVLLAFYPKVHSPYLYLNVLSMFVSSGFMVLCLIFRCWYKEQLSVSIWTHFQFLSSVVAKSPTCWLRPPWYCFDCYVVACYGVIYCVSSVNNGQLTGPFLFGEPWFVSRGLLLSQFCLIFSWLNIKRWLWYWW